MHDALDPAAVFACAKSLHDACLRRAGSDPGWDAERMQEGRDDFLREWMRVAALFVEWADDHGVSDKLQGGWIQLLEQRFGEACLAATPGDVLGRFDAADCLRVALELRLPMAMDAGLAVPFFLEVPHPLAGAGFEALRIQTVRLHRDGEIGMVPFMGGDDPYDPDFGPPVFGIYGVKDGFVEHLADRGSYEEARSLLLALLPGIWSEEVASGQ
jgi:hypothetical protein